DIAIGLRTPAHEAERIKQRYGCALASMVDKDETIEVPSVGGRQPRVIGRQILCEILEPRVEEIFQLVHREIQKCGFEDLLASGVVITGGSTLLAGVPGLAEGVLGRPGRRGAAGGRGGGGRAGGKGGRGGGGKDPWGPRGGGLGVLGPPPHRPSPVPDPRGERVPEGPRPDAGVAGGDLLGDGSPLQGCDENLRGR